MSTLIRFVEAPALFADEEKLEALAGSGLLAPFPGAGRPNYILQLPETEAASGGRRRRRHGGHPLHLGHHGHAKGVSLSHRNLVADCYLSQANLSVNPRRVLRPDAAAPFLHHDAVFLICVSAGPKWCSARRFQQADPGGPEARRGDHVPRRADAVQPPAHRHPQGHPGKGLAPSP